MRRIIIILALLSSSVLADNIFWRGNINGVWDTNTANWTGDPAGRNDNLYAEGDHVTFDDNPAVAGAALQVLTPVSPAAMLIDSDARQYSFTGTSGSSFTGGMLLTKRGHSTFDIEPSGGNDFTGGVRIAGGTLLSEFHGGFGSMGKGPVFLDGGTWSAFGINNEHGIRDIYVESNSTMNCEAVIGTAKDGNRFIDHMHGTPGSVLTVTDIESSRPFRFEGGTWHANLVDDEISSIVLSGGAGLMIVNGTLRLSVTGLNTEAEYVLIDYSDGLLTGPFLAEFGIPSGWTLDHDGTVDNPFSYVLINPNPAPKPRGPTPFIKIRGWLIDSSSPHMLF